MIIRVHEPTGTFDTEILIEDFDKIYDIPYHTKYKNRFKKIATKKYKKRGLMMEDEQSEEEEDQVEIEIGKNEDLIDDEYDEDDPEKLSIEWIRIDPELDWVCTKVLSQADYMWTSQLEKDKDVFAQYEVIFQPLILFLMERRLKHLEECHQSQLCHH